MLMIGLDGMLIRFTELPRGASAVSGDEGPALDVELGRASADSMRCIVRLRGPGGCDLLTHQHAATVALAIDGALEGLIAGLDALGARAPGTRELRLFVDECRRRRDWMTLAAPEPRRRYRLSCAGWQPRRARPAGASALTARLS